MPAIAMQVRRDLYASAIAPLVTRTARRDGEAASDAGNGDVRRDLYASAIANWNQYETTGGEAAADAGNSDAGETRSLCICHSQLANQYRNDKAAKPPLMPAIAMQVRRDLYASAIAPRYTSTGRQGGEAASDARNSDAGETRSLCICHSATVHQYWDDKAAKPPLMPAIAMQVRRDLYASAIANWQTSTGTTGGEAASDARNRDAGETRSLCICHSQLANQYWDDKAAKPPLMPAIAMQVRRDLYASAIADWQTRYWTTGGEAASDAGNRDAGEPISMHLL